MQKGHKVTIPPGVTPRVRRVVPEPRAFLFYQRGVLVGEGVEFSSGAVSACSTTDGRMMAFEDMRAFMVLQQRRAGAVHIHFLDRRCCEPHEEEQGNGEVSQEASRH